MNGADLIAAERIRQQEAEGWTTEHDAEHDDMQLVDAARAYLIAGRFHDEPPSYWPWNRSWWKPSPSDRVRELVKAGALIAAEIDRLQRQGGVKIQAPFTGAQQRALFDWQCDPRWHPFTCPNDGRTMHVGEFWWCPECDYTQDWAHSSMVVT